MHHKSVFPRSALTVDLPGEPDGKASIRAGFWKSRVGVAAVGFLVLAGILLLSEHRAHFLGVLPYFILLACPLLHVFMHRVHRAHDAPSPADETMLKDSAHELQ